MRQNCQFSPLLDRTPVQPEQAVRLGLALKNGRIPADMGPSEDLFNGIENPADILGRPADQFDAMDMQARYAAVRKPKEADPSSTTANPVNGAPASSQE